MGFWSIGGLVSIFKITISFSYIFPQQNMPRHPSKVGSWRKNSQKLEVGYLFFLLAIFFYSLPIVGLVLIFRVWGYMGYPHLLLRFFCAKMPIKDTEVLSAVKAIRMVMASSEFQTRPPTPCYVGQGWDPTLITNQQEYVDVSENSGFSPQIIHFNMGFHYKPSILGYPYFWKHPCGNSVNIWFQPFVW